ncbi:universal stress protein [Ekhidna sp. To15]|uniref:universal stress protein n=1 Tax=Ekhidna sp. To15 TaxID=3395267 RepID=UPI003F5232FA
MKKILVPTDFSKVSENAVLFALDLAEKMCGEVTLFNSVKLDYSYDFQYGDLGSISAMADDITAEAEDRMKSFIEKFKSDVEIDYKISPDSIVTAVKQLVNDDGFDLVVVGTRGTSGFEEIFIGSNAEKIVRHAPCPVITIPEHVTLQPIRKVLVPLDLSELRRGFLTRVANLQAVFECELELIWVRQSAISSTKEQELGEELAKVLKSHGLNNYRFFVVENINPQDGIFIEALESNADMVAMATHARRGIAHWLSGSTTEDTVNHLDVPVWTFKLDKSEEIIRLNAQA